MVKTGITKRYLGNMDINISCFINYKIVAKRAKETNKTRAEMAIDYCKIDLTKLYLQLAMLLLH